MKVALILEHGEAVRLKSLIDDGLEILNQQQNEQRGIDGYTLEDLYRFREILGYVKEEPKTVSKLKLQ